MRSHSYHYEVTGSEAIGGWGIHRVRRPFVRTAERLAGNRDRKGLDVLTNRAP